MTIDRADTIIMERTMSKFAKRHYEAIATVLQELREHADRASPTYKAGAIGQSINAEHLFADMFARDNSNFQYDRFIAACVPGANVKARKAA